MQELETSSIRNKQTTKLIIIKETKLEFIREIEQRKQTTFIPPMDKLY
jgi:hypothetical protein